MPQGRKIDWDSRVNSLVSELREALLERERARLESRVDAMVAGLLDGVAPTKAQPRGRKGRRSKAPAAATGAKPARRGVYKRSAAQRKAQAEKMKAYWAARRKQKAIRKAGGRKAKAEKPALAE